jgi:hypothetical protein
MRYLIDASKSKRGYILALVLLSLFIIVISLPWLQFHFLNEDANNIALGFHPQSVWQPELHSGRPLEAISYLWDAMLWGLNPQGYHFTNILLHLAVGCIFVILLRRLGTNLWFAVLSVAVWAASTGPWSVMAFVFGRLEPLWLIPGLCAIILHLGRDEDSPPPGGLRFLLILLLLTLSFGAKIIALMLLPTIITLDIAFRRRRFLHSFRSYTFIGYFFYGFWLFSLLLIKLTTFGWSAYGNEHHFTLGSWIGSNLLKLWQWSILPCALDTTTVTILIALLLALITFLLNRRSWVGWIWFLLFIIPVVTMRGIQLWYSYAPSLALPLMLTLAASGVKQSRVWNKLFVSAIAAAILLIGTVNNFDVWQLRLAGTELNLQLVSDLENEKAFLLEHYIPLDSNGTFRRSCIIRIYNLPENYRGWAVYPQALGYIYTNIILKQNIFDNSYQTGDEPVYVIRQAGQPVPLLPLEMEVKRRVFVNYQDGHFIINKEFTQAFSEIKDEDIQIVNFDLINQAETLIADGEVTIEQVAEGVKVYLSPHSTGFVYVNLPGNPNVINEILFRLKLVSEDSVPICVATKRADSTEWTLIQSKWQMPTDVWLERPLDRKRIGWLINPSPFRKFGLQVPRGNGYFIISQISMGLIEL